MASGKGLPDIVTVGGGSVPTMWQGGRVAVPGWARRDADRAAPLPRG